MATVQAGVSPAALAAFGASVRATLRPAYFETAGSDLLSHPRAPTSLPNGFHRVPAAECANATIFTTVAASGSVRIVLAPLLRLPVPVHGIALSSCPPSAVSY